MRASQVQTIILVFYAIAALVIRFLLPSGTDFQKALQLATPALVILLIIATYFILGDQFKVDEQGISSGGQRSKSGRDPSEVLEEVRNDLSNLIAKNQTVLDSQRRVEAVIKSLQKEGRRQQAWNIVVSIAITYLLSGIPGPLGH